MSALVTTLRYLQLLSTKFPTISDACTEIINLEAILNLPKGTEHFLTDLHGEYEAFLHVLKNASGSVRRKVEEIFGQTLRESEVKELCTLIYYPEQKLELIKKEEKDMIDWYRITMHQLIRVCQNVSSKYTDRKSAKRFLPNFRHICKSCCTSRKSTRTSRPMSTESFPLSSPPVGPTSVSAPFAILYSGL